MVSRSFKGILIALAGVVILAPDTLFMRWSGMGGAPMVAWRGLLFGALFLVVWALSSRTRARDLRLFLSVGGLGAAASHAINNWVFGFGIATAPVAVVLIAMATTPVWAALFSRIVIGERTGRATYVAMALVLGGVAVSVSGEGSLGGARAAFLGALAGLCVAMAMAIGFVLFRKYPALPILLCFGVGATVSGLVGFAQSAPGALVDGQLWAIALTGLFFLPVPFFAFSVAARMTPAANVSLILILETVMGPLWVWWGAGEAPTPSMWAGGAIVAVSLAGYILWTARQPAALLERST